jgi:hypothetical protein
MSDAQKPTSELTPKGTREVVRSCLGAHLIARTYNLDDTAQLLRLVIDLYHADYRYLLVPSDHATAVAVALEVGNAVPTGIFEEEDERYTVYPIKGILKHHSYEEEDLTRLAHGPDWATAERLDQEYEAALDAAMRTVLKRCPGTDMTPIKENGPLPEVVNLLRLCVEDIPKEFRREEESPKIPWKDRLGLHKARQATALHTRYLQHRHEVREALRRDARREQQEAEEEERLELAAVHPGDQGSRVEIFTENQPPSVLDSQNQSLGATARWVQQEVQSPDPKSPPMDRPAPMAGASGPKRQEGDLMPIYQLTRRPPIDYLNLPQYQNENVDPGWKPAAGAGARPPFPGHTHLPCLTTKCYITPVLLTDGLEQVPCQWYFNEKEWRWMTPVPPVPPWYRPQKMEDHQFRSDRGAEYMGYGLNPRGAEGVNASPTSKSVGIANPQS